MADEPTVQSLTISLARAAVNTANELIKPTPGLDHHRIVISSGFTADLFIKRPTSDVPDWAQFFEGYLSPEIFGKNSSTGGALLVNVRNKYFALTFGTGRFMLVPDVWEEQFGLKVTLNSVDEDTLRSIEKDSLDPLLRHTQEQASRDANAREFGFDIEQDLLRDVTGKPIDRSLGHRISGHKSLHIIVPIHLNHLPELLENVSDKFLDTSYRSKFPWVDQISEVGSAGLRDELDARLADRIASGETENIWMAVPERIEWNQVRGFQFPHWRKIPEYHDIHLEYFLSSIGQEPITPRILKKRRVLCVDDAGTKLHEWSAFECLYAELAFNHNSYLLSGGKWYGVKAGFARDVNDAYQRIPDYSRPFPDFDHDSEAAYLKWLVESDPNRFALMDRKNISYGGGHSKIEFCDLFTKDSDIVHVKRYGQSSALSHLFAQGVNSGELFQMETKFRDEVNNKLPTSHLIQNTQIRPKRNQFQVVFAIVSDRPGPLRLPFFSRLNLKHAARHLMGYGFRVAKTKIAVSQRLSKLVKYRERAASR